MMDTDHARDLGRRALMAGYSSCDVEPMECPVWRDGLGRLYRDLHHGRVGWPDFRDPATLGTLVAQVRERWGDPGVHAIRDTGAGRWVGVPVWRIRASDGYDLPRTPTMATPTEAEAWVMALEAVPKVTP